MTLQFHPESLAQRLRRPGETTYEPTGLTSPGHGPYIEAGSDYEQFLSVICAGGIITQTHARTFGWPDTRLRVTAHWLRRHGAALRTTHVAGELAYTVAGHAGVSNQPLSNVWQGEGQRRRRLPRNVVIGRFVGATSPAPTPAPTPAPWSAAAAWTRANSATAPTATSTALGAAVLAALGAAPLAQGLSAPVADWLTDRRAQIAAAALGRTIRATA